MAFVCCACADAAVRIAAASDRTTERTIRAPPRTAARPCILLRALLDRAHQRLAAMLLAVGGDRALVVGEALEVEHRLVARGAEVTAHPVGEHLLPLRIRGEILLAGDQRHVDLELPARRTR